MASSTQIAASPKPQSNLLTTEEAAAYLGVKPRSLEVWRCVKRYGIPYVKVGRLIKYRQSELDAWLASRTIGSKSE